MIRDLNTEFGFLATRLITDLTLVVFAINHEQYIFLGMLVIAITYEAHLLVVRVREWYRRKLRILEYQNPWGEKR